MPPMDTFSGQELWGLIENPPPDIAESPNRLMDTLSGRAALRLTWQMDLYRQPI